MDWLFFKYSGLTPQKQLVFHLQFSSLLTLFNLLIQCVVYWIFHLLTQKIYFFGLFYPTMHNEEFPGGFLFGRVFNVGLIILAEVQINLPVQPPVWGIGM
jgi:hypothetical protein